MINTYQFKNLNILEHGLAVRKQYLQIIADLETKRTDRYEFPEPLIEKWKRLKKRLFKSSIMSYYQIYHDCGKPEALIIDDVTGKQHFPNHAEYSASTFLETFSHIKDAGIITKLIKYDMIFHSGSQEEIDDFIRKNDKSFVFSLWLTSFAELYANKAMFDSANQTSFKIKHKKLKRVLNKII